MTPAEVVMWAAYIGAVMGVLWRAIFPFLIKRAEDEKKGIVTKFAIKYVYSLIISVVITLVIMFMAVDAVPLPETGEGVISTFFGAFVFGMVFHDGANKVVELMMKAYAPAPPPAP